MTENETVTANNSVKQMISDLDKIEQEIRQKNAVFSNEDQPLVERTDLFVGNNEEWRPNVAKISKAELRRRRLAAERAEASAGIIKINVDVIIPNRSQPRTTFETNSVLRLADSIRRYGILQPLSVRLIDTKNNRNEKSVFEIIAGERRYRAAKLVGLESVPCIILDADDKRSAELALIENLLREDLNIFEVARGLRRLIEGFGLTQEEVAKRLSMSQSAVANKLRLLRYSPEEESFILENGLTERHARALLRFKDPEERFKAMRSIAALRMNVSKTEAFIDKQLSISDSKETCSEQKVIPVLKDVRLFYNSIDRAVELVRSAGVEISSERHNDGEGVKIEINIPYPYGRRSV